jgi:histidinol-phosphatase
VDLSADLDFARSLADTADAISLERFRAADLHVSKKADSTHVTDADQTVERALRERLATERPDDAFLGEETTADTGAEAVSEGHRQWVIDPIDGTANFARRLPHWCVSIAFVTAGRIELGVIYDPNGDLLYSARRGAGARRNGAVIRVSVTDDPARATVDIGYSRRAPSDDFARIMTRLLEQGVNVTLSGSAALGLARVADGRLDGYAERHLYSWDALAGLLLVEEAGGRVNQFLERDALTAGNETIAATPDLYSVIAGALDPR